MIQTKLRVGAPSITIPEDTQITIPVVLPDLHEIRQLANELHARGQEFDDEMWGWPVQYDPELAEPPLDSSLDFTPAFFWIGVWPVWYVSFTWEHGRDQEPTMLMSQM